jgi:hypothetical protein
MRLRLSPRAPRLLVLLGALGMLAALVVLLRPRPLVAEDRITLRGNYYRETSTRILAPVVYVEKDAPDERFTIGAEYLLDAVTSASIGAGAAAVTGGDFLFTEFRHESTLRFNSKLKLWNFGGYFRYSTESDWISRSFGVYAARDVFKRAGTVSISYTANFDSVNQIYGGRIIPWNSTGDTNLQNVNFLSLGYTHALTPRLLAGALAEGIVATGPQENPYRKVINGLDESHPLLRRRGALSGFLRFAVPRTPLVLEPRYRLSGDDWGIVSHGLDLRAHIRFLKRIILRARYRYYTQSGAYFWLPDGAYGPDAVYRTADPKMTKFHSHTPGIELTFELDGLAARVPGLHFLRGAWISANYNHIFQTNRFGNARLGSLAFSIPF